MAKGGMDLVDAMIEGSLECHNATFGARKNKHGSENGTAIFASRAKISGSVFLQQTFSADGPTVFRDARIGGNFECSGGKFERVKDVVSGKPAGDEVRARRAIDCQGAQIGGGVFFRQRNKESKDANFKAAGEICFIDTRIGGSFECHGAEMSNPGGNALICSRTNVAGSVFLHEGFKAQGRVGFRRAAIGGNFECSGGRFEGGTSDTGRPDHRLAIDCQGSKIGGSVNLRKYKDEDEEKPFTATGEVRFIDAEVAGSFECHCATIENGKGDALGCSRIEVGGSVLLIDGFHAQGKVSFRRADVGGNFDASCGNFTNIYGKALSCENIHVTGHVRLGFQSASTREAQAGNTKSPANGSDNAGGGRKQNKHFSAEGIVDFSGAQIEGDFECSGGTFEGGASDSGKPEDRLAINCQGAKIGGNVNLRKHKEEQEEKLFKAYGEVRFIDAKVSGSFECHSANILNGHGDALGCSRIEVGGSVLLIDGVLMQGEVSFRRADVGGNFDASYGKFINRVDKALSCENIHVTGHVLLGTKSSSSLDVKGDRTKNKAEASSGKGAVTGDNCGADEDEHFEAEGKVDFSGARIEGGFDCEGGHFINRKARETRADACANSLNLRLAGIAGALRLGEKRPNQGRPVIKGAVDLRGARVTVLIDSHVSWPEEKIQAWPDDKIPINPVLEERAGQHEGRSPDISKKFLSCYIYLDGFSYGSFGSRSPLDADFRKKWLLRQPDADNLKPQPYEQLINVLQTMGEAEDAIRIAIFREGRRTLRSILPISGFKRAPKWLKSLGNWLLPSQIRSVARWIFKRVFWKLFIGVPFGYGYRLHRALLGAIVFWFVCSVLYGSLYDAGYIGLNKELKDNQESQVQFNGYKYSTDAMLPLIGFGERARWVFVDPKTKTGGDGSIPIYSFKYRLFALPKINYVFFDHLHTVEMLLGWLFGISLGIVLSQKINRK